MATKTYLAIADRAPNEALFSIVFPAFPGVTSVAGTLAEVIVQAADALATAVDDMRADNEALPPAVEDGAPAPAIPAGAREPVLLMVPVEVGGPAIRVDVSLDAVLLARVDAVAARTGTTRSELLAEGARLAVAMDAAQG